MYYLYNSFSLDGGPLAQGASLVMSLEGFEDNSTTIGRNMQNFVLLCAAVGNPTPAILWFRNAAEIAESSSVGIEQTSSLTVDSGRLQYNGTSILTIERFSFSNRGKYKCMASNNVNATVKNACSATEVVDATQER